MERIYTIPVNEAFDASLADPGCGCPLCTLYNKLEEDELELILGGSMMEPDVRIKTNELGFCGTHFDKLFKKKNRLGLGLILESHLAEIEKSFKGKGIASLFTSKSDKVRKTAEKLDCSCYICQRIEHNFSGMLSTVVLLFEEDEAFRKKLSGQPYFCLPHTRRLLERGEGNLSKKMLLLFNEAVMRPVKEYLATLLGDVSWFCKKFDYRYGEEPWYNAKDSIERAILFLSGTER